MTLQTDRPAEQDAHEQPLADSAQPEDAQALPATEPNKGRFDGVRAFLRDARTWFGAVWGRIWKVIGPVLTVVTRLGWTVLALAVLCLAVGLFCGWIELVAVGGILLIAFLAAIPFALGRASYEVEIELNPRRVTVGDRALGRLMVRNAGDERVLPTRMEFPVGLGRAEFGIPSLEPGEPHEELFAVPTSRRAVIPAGPAMSIRGDELSLLRRTVKWTGVIELFVHPRRVHLAPGAAGLLRDLEGVVSNKITDADLAFHALRPYEPGDDRRYIHWRTSARTGTLMVRQFQETRKSHLTIIQSLDREFYANEDEFEMAISVVASLGEQAIRDDVAVDIATERGVTPTRSLVAMLDDLSRFEAMDGKHESLRAFTLNATRRLAPPSVVVIVGGRGLSRSELRAVSSLFPHEVQVTGIICDTSSTLARSQTNDITVCTIPRLDDLPKAVAA
ncbi:DUF58 domain-containing protein [Pseudoclavibacter alba]|uniref:DUF58 domain-containing protein n=1 Tax=Pseudoclavibacter albus TaxID=272241 RepID=UPI0019D06A96|nr:DUF58 domain-containing protein [Pseudoclavibacter alba]MBN6778198.1 DUF58 domain-containing protein [Pseudoclavibacter alba]